jgi:hypothetical protein
VYPCFNNNHNESIIKFRKNTDDDSGLMIFMQDD